MARGAIAETFVNSRSGATFPGTETTGDPVNGHSFVWGPRKLLVARNTSGSTAYSITVTPSGAGLDIFTAPAKVVSLPFGNTQIYGPYPKVFAHPEDGDRVWVDVANAAIVLSVIDIGG